MCAIQSTLAFALALLWQTHTQLYYTFINRLVMIFILRKYFLLCYIFEWWWWWRPEKSHIIRLEKQPTKRSSDMIYVFMLNIKTINDFADRLLGGLWVRFVKMLGLHVCLNRNNWTSANWWYKKWTNFNWVNHKVSGYTCLQA